MQSRVREWECCLEDTAQRAAEGARSIADHIIRLTDRALDDVAGVQIDEAMIRSLLGLSRV